MYKLTLGIWYILQMPFDPVNYFVAFGLLISLLIVKSKLED